MAIESDSLWYQPSLRFIHFVLLPFSWLFRLLVAVRRWLFCKGLLAIQTFPVPVIVVGNITVGGTGKTPFVIWLIQLLQAQGYQPGIVSRGYGGIKQRQPVWVRTDSPASVVGDEALLLARKTGCPMVVGIDRAAAVKKLLRDSTCDVVVSDDGLQHYRLGRDVEIAIVDGARRFGNQQLLPAGPLRESVKRLESVDFVVVNQGNDHDVNVMTMMPTHLMSLVKRQKMSLTHLVGKKVHAVAGIGHPSRFFNHLRQAGLDVVEHVFPDHHLYQASDFDFHDENPIVMTEKDAVKCSSFADEQYWFLAVDVEICGPLQEKLLSKLKMIGARHDVK